MTVAMAVIALVVSVVTWVQVSHLEMRHRDLDRRLQNLEYGADRDGE